ncbi:LCP family protein [Nocardioides nitrophenolicus]|uniref:LCP family protein n=1 Tax=Nocardioides nitrophenolicus TaxID=60489 RepID=UPI0027DE0410|nr:LCP family protein [Nocardioides nitrophenolicus]MBM7519288.1 LCP family protein required for cell wall assembly [Nocardioides nitrophenolicus]
MPQLPVDERAARVRFRRALTLMAFTLVVPGSAQLIAGNRAIGRLALRIWLFSLATLLAVAAWSWHDKGFALSLAFSPTAMLVIRLYLIAGALGWAALFVDAWRIGQPLSLRMPHRRAVVGVNGVLCFSVAGTMLFGAHLAAAQREWLTMFADGDLGAAHNGRYNILLIGGDSGNDRWGLRTDSMTVASVDATTGRTVMIGLPRNMQNFPFRKGSVMAEQFPKGFDCDGCYLNGVSTWVGDHTQLFQDSKNPGIDATVSAIEGITDLDINYWVMVNMRGFERLVNAFGGVTLNVRQRIPVGGLGKDVTGYIEPGKRKLNGHDALWYARAREGSDDYSRMARQKCVFSALVSQVSPAQALTNFQEIAKASSAMIQTNIPGGALGDFVQLALRARTQKISSVSLVPPRINTADPDIDLVQKMIRNAVDRAEGDRKAAKKATTPAEDAATPSGDAGEGDQGGDQATEQPAQQSGTVTGGSLGSRNEGYQANETDDVAAAC